MSWIKNVFGFAKIRTYSHLHKKLRKSEILGERNDRILSGSQGCGFFDWNLETNNMTWEGAFWHSIGYDDSDVEKITNTFVFWNYVHPEDQDELMDHIRFRIHNQNHKDIVFRVKKKHGGYVWAEARAGRERGDNGRVKFISGIIYDVSKVKQTEEALKQSEQLHARIIESSNDGIWEWTEEGGNSNFTNRCWGLLGYEDNDDEIHIGVDRVQIWQDRIHPGDRVKINDVLVRHLKKLGPFDVEYRIKAKNGNWRWLRARGQVKFNEHGRATRMSGTNMDITVIKEAEAKVIAAKEMAERANRAKSEFLSSMSHELRTPLNAILGFTQLFDLDASLNPAQAENINEIERAGKHLLQLIGDVLDFAKIESGKVDFDLEKLNLKELVEDTLPMLRNLAIKNNIKLEFNALVSGEPLVRADRVRLKQIFLNLISNAIKYNFPNGRVTVVLSKTKNNQLLVAVKDTGVGIPEKQHKNIFQAFNRLNQENKEYDTIEGSGVGLVITKQLVEQMGGEIGFESEEGQGSTFWVSFPFYDFSLDEIEAVEDEAELVAKSDELPSKQGLPTLQISSAKSILYIEDNPPNQRLMRKVLSMFPVLKLDVFDDALKGIFVARTSNPDLIILDINMQSLNGYDVLSVLRQDKKTASIPVIALSSNAMSYDIDRGLTAGFDAYLTKPINLPKLIDSINDAINKTKVVEL